MDPLKIVATGSTPEISLDANSGIFKFKGKSVPDDAEQFYSAALEWIEAYVGNALDETQVEFNLEFFNIASSKRILFILYKLNELMDAGKHVLVKWHYIENDHDMLEVGQDYAFMVKVPFEFVRSKKPIPQPL